MKKLIFVFISSLLMGSMYAQDTLPKKLTKSELRKQRKAEERALVQKDYISTASIIQSQKFVIEADYLSTESGPRRPINSLVNFILFDSTNSIIQVATLNSSPGSNGVGGVTAKGNVTSWKFDQDDKRMSFSVNTNVMTVYGTYNIYIYINAVGGATAYLSGNSYGKIIFDGRIVPLKSSRVYKAQGL